MLKENVAGHRVYAIFDRHPNRALSNREIFEIAAVLAGEYDLDKFALDGDDISAGLKYLRKQKLITVCDASEKDGKYSRYRVVR